MDRHGLARTLAPARWAAVLPVLRAWPALAIDLRNAIWGLRSPSVRTDELATALEARLARMTAGTGITAVVALYGRRGATWPSAVATHLVHIVREAVANALKHAQPRAVRVELTVEEDRVCLVVEDDGEGMTATQAPGAGRGLDNMRARADSLRGALEVAPGHVGGTRVTLIAPMASRRS